MDNVERNNEPATEGKRTFVRVQHSKAFIDRIRSWRDRNIEQKYGIDMTNMSEEEKASTRSTARLAGLVNGVTVVVGIAALVSVLNLWDNLGLDKMAALDKDLKGADEIALVTAFAALKRLGKKVTDYLGGTKYSNGLLDVFANIINSKSSAAKV